MRKQLLSNEINRVGTLLIVGSLLLVIVLGCSNLERFNKAKHPGWNLQEACAYLQDTDMKSVGQPNDGYCHLGGQLQDDGLVRQERVPANVGSVTYIIRGKAGKAEEINLTVYPAPGKEEANKEIFLNYSEKLFQRALGISMPEDVRKAILEDKGKPGEPEIFYVKGAKISLLINKYDSNYKNLEIKR